MKIEILGYGIERALDELGIAAKKTCAATDPYGVHYDVWEIEKAGMEKLESVPKWPEDWGWWRYTGGSNLGDVDQRIQVHDKPLLVWKTSRVWFPDIFSYVYHVGATSPKNVCALLSDLAEQNRITMAALLREYGSADENAS